MYFVIANFMFAGQSYKRSFVCNLNLAWGFLMENRNSIGEKNNYSWVPKCQNVVKQCKRVWTATVVRSMGLFLSFFFRYRESVW